MVIVAALCWFNEPPEFLDRLVRSLEGVADSLLAVDGRWDLFPADRDDSPIEQSTAIIDAADAVGLPFEMHGGTWDSQVAKRDYMMRRAGIEGDWVLVVDGDEFVCHADMSAVRAKLAGTIDLHVAQAMTVPQNLAWPYDGLPKNPRPVRKLFRAGTRMPGPAHNVYRYDDDWLMGDLAHVKVTPAIDVSADLHIAHDNANRGDERNAAAKAYRRERSERRVEAWV